MAVLQWTVRAVQLQSALSPVETALQTLHQPSRLLHANCGPDIANCGQAIAKCVAGIVMEGYMVAGRGGQQEQYYYSDQTQLDQGPGEAGGKQRQGELQHQQQRHQVGGHLHPVGCGMFIATLGKCLFWDLFCRNSNQKYFSQ